MKRALFDLGLFSSVEPSIVRVRATWWLTIIVATAVVGVGACGDDGEPGPFGNTATGTTTSSGGGGAGGNTTATGAGGNAGEGGTAGSGGGSGGDGGAGGGAELHVLFVGNSYTASGVPELVRDLSLAGDPTFVVESVTAGGATLQDHVDNTGAVAAIGSGTWDAVVLQGQSVEPLFQPSVFQNAALALDVHVDAAGAATVFFETWARAPGHAVYNEAWSGGDPTAMQAGLRAGYQQAAAATGGVMAPVGDAWETSLAAHPSVVLHAGDGSHPTTAGTYLAACVFYLVLSGQATIPAPAPAPGGLSEADAATLRAVAEATPW